MAMLPLKATSYNFIFRLKLFPAILPVSTQVRWRKTPKRKPRWLPMAVSKVFRIPVHPYVSPDQKQLNEDLLDEYYRKQESLRKFFQDEIKQKAVEKEAILIEQQRQEEEFKLLLEENKKENKRMKIIREDTLEKEFQEKQLEWLQMAEEKKQELEKTKLKVEGIIRAEKEKSKSYITLDNIDQVIEKAIDSPVNISFTITVDGTINWEGKPSLQYEDDITRRVSKSKEL